MLLTVLLHARLDFGLTPLAKSNRATDKAVWLLNCLSFPVRAAIMLLCPAIGRLGYHNVLTRRRAALWRLCRGERHEVCSDGGAAIWDCRGIAFLHCPKQTVVDAAHDHHSTPDGSSICLGAKLGDRSVHLHAFLERHVFTYEQVNPGPQAGLAGVDCPRA